MGIRNCDQDKSNLLLVNPLRRLSTLCYYFTAMPVFYSLDRYRLLQYVFFFLLGDRRAKGLFSDICPLATVNAKGSPCVPSEEESCDKKVRPVAENSAYAFLSIFINPIILVCVLSDM